MSNPDKLNWREQDDFDTFMRDMDFDYDLAQNLLDNIAKVHEEIRERDERAD